MRNEEINVDPTQTPDFVPHRGKTGMWHVVALFSGLIFIESIIILALGTINIYIAWALVVLSGAIAASFAITRIQSILDKTMSAEFLCTQLANAYAMDFIFGMIIKRDGTVTYANNGLREMFPQFAHNEEMALEALFEAGGVAKGDREDVWAKMSRNQQARLTFPMTDSEGKSELYTLDIAPLARPKGFFSLRARHYIAKRENHLNTTPDTQDLPNTTASTPETSLPQLSHTYDALPIPVCVCDMTGKIIFSNQSFSVATGLTADKIALGTYLNEYVNDATGNAVGLDILHEHAGHYLLSDTQGKLKEVHIHFYTITNPEGAHVGYGMIIPS